MLNLRLLRNRYDSGRTLRILIYSVLFLLVLAVSFPFWLNWITTGSSDVNEIQQIMKIKLPPGATDIEGDSTGFEEKFFRLRFVLPEDQIPILLEQLGVSQLQSSEKKGSTLSGISDFPSPMQGAKWEEDGKNQHWTLLISAPDKQKVKVFLELANY